MPDLFAVSYVALWVLVVLQALILLGLTRAFAEMRGGRAEKPSMQGRPVPTFSAMDLAGNEVSTTSIAGRPVVLLFVSPTCASCRVTLAELRGIASDSTRDLIVVCAGGEDDCRMLATDYQLTRPVVVDANGELKLQFGISGTPMAVRISATGTIESYGEPVRGEDLEALLATSRASRPETPIAGGSKTIADDYSNV
jgi:peroxiredoxin